MGLELSALLSLLLKPEILLLIGGLGFGLYTYTRGRKHQRDADAARHAEAEEDLKKRLIEAKRIGDKLGEARDKELEKLRNSTDHRELLDSWMRLWGDKGPDSK